MNGTQAETLVTHWTVVCPSGVWMWLVSYEQKLHFGVDTCKSQMVTLEPAPLLLQQSRRPCVKVAELQDGSSWLTEDPEKSCARASFDHQWLWPEQETNLDVVQAVRFQELICYCSLASPRLTNSTRGNWTSTKDVSLKQGENQNLSLAKRCE